MKNLLKNKIVLLYTGLFAVLIVIGIVVYTAVFVPAPESKGQTNAFPTPEQLAPVDASVVVKLMNGQKANTVKLAVEGLDSKYMKLGYEFTYESNGLIKGVNTGSSPIDVAGEDTFSREIYLGTCSRNVCTPDVGVETVSVVVEFTDVSGKRSQFTGDFEI